MRKRGSRDRILARDLRRKQTRSAGALRTSADGVPRINRNYCCEHSDREIASLIRILHPHFALFLSLNDSALPIPHSAFLILPQCPTTCLRPRKCGSSVASETACSSSSGSSLGLRWRSRL